MFHAKDFSREKACIHLGPRANHSSLLIYFLWFRIRIPVGEGNLLFALVVFCTPASQGLNNRAPMHYDRRQLRKERTTLSSIEALFQ
jgi:hypothetical protein